MIRQLTEQNSRHAVFVQRYAGHLSNLFDPFIKRMQKEIRIILLSEGSTTSQRKINSIARDIRKSMAILYSSYNDDTLFGELDAFALSEAEFEVRSINNVLALSSANAPLESQILAAIRSTPLVFQNPEGVTVLEPFIRNWQKKEIDRVSDIIKVGFTIGQTNQQIANSITGKNKLLDKVTRRNIKTMVRTATNHVSSTARMQSMSENDDIIIGYTWLATLDNRTCPLCAPLDGKDFLWADKYKPLPPLHPNDRCTTTPLLDKRFRIDDSGGKRASKGLEGGKQVSSSETYYSWLKKQPVSFQNDTIGVTKATLLRNGGLTIDEFRRFSTDRLFRPITLNEMKAKDPLVFQNANIG